jgi:hypothetical protein
MVYYWVYHISGIVGDYYNPWYVIIYNYYVGL